MSIVCGHGRPSSSSFCGRCEKTIDHASFNPATRASPEQVIQSKSSQRIGSEASSASEQRKVEMALIPRLLLGLSSLFGLVIGLGLFGAGMYGMANRDIVSRLAKGFDLSAVPQADKMKSDIVAKIEALGIVETVATVFLVTGIIIIVVVVLGLAAAITALKVIVIIYILAIVLLMLTFLIFIIIVSSPNAVLEKPVATRMVAAQNKYFVSILAMVNGKAGEGAFVTVLFNMIQLMFDCCGWRTVGDIRDSPTWQASPRGLADLLKLNKEGVGISGVLSDGPMSDGDVRRILSDMPPAWIVNRLPPGATLPPGVNLPDKLPEGVRIPTDFNISLDILNDPKAIRQLFEQSLVLQTPVTCCRLKEKSMNSLEAKDLVALLVDPNCPFQAGNVGVHEETCFKALTNSMKAYTAIIAIVGVIACCMFACNLGLAIQILLCG